MADVHEAILDEIVHEGETLGPRGLVDLIERNHDQERPGVHRETVIAYVEALADRRDYSFDAEGLVDGIDERVTESESWDGRDALYVVGEERLSAYPEAWHERLDGETDVTAYLEYLRESEPEFVSAVGRSDRGVPEDTLADVMAVVGGLDREEAMASVHRARDAGQIEESADQHPQGEVYLAGDFD